MPRAAMFKKPAKPASVAVCLRMTTHRPGITVHLGDFESIKAGMQMMQDVVRILRAQGGWPGEGSGLILYLKDRDDVTRGWRDW